jgi:hypothetical protein
MHGDSKETVTLKLAEKNEDDPEVREIFLVETTF